MATETSNTSDRRLTDAGRGLVHCRVNGAAVWAARSANMMVSVTERPTAIPPTFDDTAAERFKLIDKAYVHTTRVGNTFWCLATSDPTPTGDFSTPGAGALAPVTTFFFKGTVTDGGAIRNAAGNILGYLWGPAPTAGSPLIAITGSGSKADLVYTAQDNDGVRWYDVARGGDAILGCQFDRRDFQVDDTGTPVQSGRSPLNGGTYVCFRRTGSATSNTWAIETIAPTGKPFGAFASVYIGGPRFEAADTLGNAALTIEESNNVWQVVRRIRSGPQYAAGTWALDKVLYTAPPGYKLGRLEIPSGSEMNAAGQRVFVVSQYPDYDIRNFTTYRSDQIVRTY